MTTIDDKRSTLKSAGWRRSDRVASGEWWTAPKSDRSVRLDTAWRHHLKSTPAVEVETTPLVPTMLGSSIREALIHDAIVEVSIAGRWVEIRKGSAPLAAIPDTWRVVARVNHEKMRAERERAREGRKHLGAWVQSNLRRIDCSRAWLADIMSKQGYGWTKLTVDKIIKGDRPLRFAEARYLCRIFDDDFPAAPIRSFAVEDS